MVDGVALGALFARLWIQFGLGRDVDTKRFLDAARWLASCLSSSRCRGGRSGPDPIAHELVSRRGGRGLLTE